MTTVFSSVLLHFWEVSAPDAQAVGDWPVAGLTRPFVDDQRPGELTRCERANVEQHWGELHSQNRQRRLQTSAVLAGRVTNFCSLIAFEGVPVLKHKRRLEKWIVDRWCARLSPGASIPILHVRLRPTSLATGLATHPSGCT